MLLSLITCLVLLLVTQVLAVTNYCSTQGNCFVQKANSYNVSTSSIPFIRDPGLHIEKVYQGLEFPTSIAFLNQSDIIVLEKNRGTVNRITNGSMHEEPLIDVNVSNLGERGLLGVLLPPI